MRAKVRVRLSAPCSPTHLKSARRQIEVKGEAEGGGGLEVGWLKETANARLVALADADDLAHR